MSEDLRQDAAPANKRRLWLAIGGGGAALAVVGAVLFLGRDGDVVWSDSKVAEPATVQAAPKPAAAPVAAPLPSAATEIRGVVKAKSEATIASRITARITFMPYKTGQRFGRGATLARFDCSTTQAQLTAARAASTAYQTTYNTNVELDQYQAIGKNDVAVAKANLGKASAEAAAIAAQLHDCQITAPFEGRVVEQIAHVQEIAASGQPLLKIQSGGDLEADLIVPSRWLTWLAPGAPFRFKIDETGETVSGRITRLGAAVDPVSRTIRVTGNLVAATALVLPGMSGSAIFAQERQADAIKPAADGKPS